MGKTIANTRGLHARCHSVTVVCGALCPCASEPCPLSTCQHARALIGTVRGSLWGRGFAHHPLGPVQMAERGRTSQPHEGCSSLRSAEVTPRHGPAWSRPDACLPAGGSFTELCTPLTLTRQSPPPGRREPRQRQGQTPGCLRRRAKTGSQGGRDTGDAESKYLLSLGSSISMGTTKGHQVVKTHWAFIPTQ